MLKNESLFVMTRKILPVFCLLFLFDLLTAFSNPNYSLRIANVEKIDNSTIEFDIFVKSDSSDFELTSYQCAFNFNQNISSSDISFSYIEGSSQLNSTIPNVAVAVNKTDSSPKLTFASMPGSDIISTTESKVGRFRITTSGTFDLFLPEIGWCFDGKINTIVTGRNFEDVTSEGEYSNEGLEKIPILNVTASATSDTNTSPEKTIDGKGAEDGDPNSRWAAQPMPAYLIFDLGSEKNIGETKFSFYEWDNGRIYQYSISVSSDLSTWENIVSNASSSSEEWTLNAINKSARYIKLTFLSHNQTGGWAGLWEAQVFAGIKTNDEIVNENKHVPMINIPISISNNTGNIDSLFIGMG
jgi:F5/8 type C domain